MTKRTEAVPSTAGEIAKTPATAKELPAVSGVDSGAWNSALIGDVAQASGCGGDLSDEGALERARGSLAAVRSFAPGDAVEDMAAAQLVSLHTATMRCLTMAAHHEQPAPVAREYMNLANRTSRTWAVLAEALARHRGKASTQRVIVERVEVREGGQAIVGAVEQPGRGGG